LAATVQLPACAPGDDPLQSLRPAPLAGPAHGSSSAGRITHGWSLDSGALTVAPAAAGSVPALSDRQAACNLLAALTPNNEAVAEVAPRGSSLGFGTLTIAPTVARGFSYATAVGVATPPPPPTYRARPAWILTISYAAASSCPAMPFPATSPTPRPTLPQSWDYQVYAVDASTGADAVGYVESHPANCTPTTEPASRWVPYEQLSVPWRGLSIAAGGSTGTIQAAYSSCDGFPSSGGAWVSRSRPEVQVSVMRVLGQHCPPASWHSMTLHPPTVTETVPSTLAHSPVGPIDHPAVP
jgi:hypothetical protein